MENLEYKVIASKGDIVLYEIRLGNIHQGYRARQYFQNKNYREVSINGPSWNKALRKLHCLEKMEENFSENQNYLLFKKKKKKRHK